MSAHVDTSSPQCFDYTAFNKKKIQLLEDRQTEIERENQMLLNKITKIMATEKGQTQKKNPVRFQRVGINETKRKNDLIKITIENQNILKRIKDKKSVYDARTLAKEYQKHKQIKKNLCEYPVLENKLQSSTYDNNASIIDPNYRENMQTQQDDVSNLSNGYKNQRRSQSTKNNMAGKRLEPLHYEPGQLGHRVLMKKSRKLGTNLFIIEVSIKDGIFRITADDVENPLTRVLEMFESDGMKVVQQFFDGSVERLIDNLKITDKIYIKGLEKYQQEEKQQQSVQQNQKQNNKQPQSGQKFIHPNHQVHRQQEDKQNEQQQQIPQSHLSQQLNQDQEMHVYQNINSENEESQVERKIKQVQQENEQEQINQQQNQLRKINDQNEDQQVKTHQYKQNNDEEEYGQEDFEDEQQNNNNSQLNKKLENSQLKKEQQNIHTNTKLDQSQKQQTQNDQQSQQEQKNQNQNDSDIKYEDEECEID
ncbi:hypothetical protein PPERSA_06902 [Pseudocohnilembus persalinus]|uniref:Uncharacterized protein n=1 Tax=Pseudocohnilembus persalinus TaxID=266149 RepID=A0A0V0QYB7_PSEPJ|nr:hypothetical protein PPERSA_06902 [Pseudocohnilembus persalinus]|eukprot:KRX07287.1 hypothetical protein PPERSA_06902 [Pseudocohnilembus persalinus]